MANLVLDTSSSGLTAGTNGDYVSITIVEGGILTSGVQTGGGFINVSEGGKVYDVIVSSGRFWASNGGYVSGADVLKDRFYLYDNAAYTGQERPAIIASDIRFSGGTMTIRGSYTHVYNIIATGGTAHIQNAATIHGLTAAGNAKINMNYATDSGNVDYTATTLTISNATIRTGATLAATGANGKSTVISGLNVEAGANVTLQTSVTALLSSGNTVEAGVVSNAAVISAQSGAMVRNVVLSNGGSLFLGKGTTDVGAITPAERGGSAEDITVFLGGRIQPQAFGSISGTVLSGGTAQVYYGASSFHTQIYANGYERVHGNCVAYDAEVFNGCQFVSADAQLSNGVEGKGGVAVRTTVYEGGSLMLISGGTASGATIKAGGQIWFNSVGADKTKGIATAVDLKVEAGGSVVIGANGAYPIALGGAETTIAVGTISGHDSAYAVSGVLHDMDWTANATILSGLTLKDNTVAGSMSLQGGAKAEDVAINTNGSMYLDSGASAENVTVNAGTLRLFAGASGTGADVNGGNFNLYDAANQTGVARANIEFEAVRVSAGNAILRGVNVKGSDFTVRGGKLYIQNGAELDKLSVSTGGVVSMNYNATTGNVDYNATSAVARNVVISAGGNFYAIGEGIAVSGLEFAGSGYAYFSSGAAMSGITNNQGSMYLYTGAAAYGLAQEAGTIRIFAGASGSGADVRAGNVYLYDNANQTGVARADIKMEALRLSGGQAILRGVNVKGSDFTVRGGKLYIQNGADLDGVVVSNGGVVSMNYNSTADQTDYNATSITASRVTVSTGGTFNTLGGDGMVVSGLELDGGYFNASSGADIRGLIVSSGRFWASNGGVVSGVDVIDDRFYLYDNVNLTDVERAAIIGSDIRISGGSMVLRGVNASAYDVTVSGGRMYVQNGAVAENVIVSSGAKLRIRTQAGGNVDYDKDGALVNNAAIFADGIVEIESGGVLSGGVFASGASLTVYKHGQAGFASVAAGAEINLSFWDVNEGAEPGNADALVSDWGTFDAGATVNVSLVDAAVGREYKVADSANANVTLNCLDCYRGVFDVVVKSGETASNAFQGIDYDFTDGKSITFSSFTVGTQTTAATLTSANATVLTDGGLATKWDSTTDVSTIPAAVAGTNTTGNAWLTVDGADIATALYGAQGNFGHDVNLWLYEGTVRNLAAGATAGGSVENVNLLLSDAGEGADKLNFTGVAYLGGFGTVNGEITAAVYGGTYDKDFYAGALANKLSAQTAVGGIDLTVTGGKFKGNLYGASAVKTVDGTGSGVRNTTGDVTLTVTNGEATKSDFCLFAGGYATGTATGTVYTVDSVTADISGGDWGDVHGGRGIFGGIMASGVGAEVIGDVTLTISGGSAGNVYGGGWAQKTNGHSAVGNVNISIAGGTVANVFGGGSHSTSGGTTETGDVTITVSGGSISGAIYARGQLDGDIAGAASVIFTGATDFGCGVFGYSYVGGAAGGAALSFAGVSDELTGYTGTFSGAIGGFDNITFAGATAMTLATAAADVSNGAWEFDLTERASSLAGASLLIWSGADFTNDAIAVSFANETQAKAGWNIATVAEAFSGTTFDLYVGGAEIVSGLAYGGQIADGDYQGWGFALDEGVLKFKNLANA